MIDVPNSRSRLEHFGTKFRILRIVAELGEDFREEARFFFRDQQVAADIGLTANVWSNVKRGAEAISAARLAKLAERFKLDDPVYLGPAAWRHLLDETSVAEFERLLYDCDYGWFGVLRRANGNRLRAALDDLAPFRPSLDGLDFEIVQVKARGRGLISPEAAEAEEMVVDLPTHTRVRIHVNLERPNHVVVLDLRVGRRGEAFQAEVLAPSWLARTTPLAVGQTLPTEGEEDRRALVVFPPLEQHNLLAFVFEDPLDLPWRQPEKGFPELTPGEFSRFLGYVRERGPSAVRVLSRPYRVVT